MNPLISMKCDNDDGTINWDRRARILAFCSRLANISLEDTLEQLGDNPEFASKVEEYWDELKPYEMEEK
jgi:hypothetical protein